MRRHLDPQISREIIQVADSLPRFIDGIQADFTNAPEAFTVNVTLLHNPQSSSETSFEPTPETQALLTRRGAGGSLAYMWSGVSGFIGHSSDPAQPETLGAFDPISYSAYVELQEECCMMPDDLDRIELFLGGRFTEPFGEQGILHVMPVIGVYSSLERPEIVVDGQELVAAKWVPLGDLAQHPDLTPDYVTGTVTNALGGLGLSMTTARQLLGLR